MHIRDCEIGFSHLFCQPFNLISLIAKDYLKYLVQLEYLPLMLWSKYHIDRKEFQIYNLLSQLQQKITLSLQGLTHLF